MQQIVEAIRAEMFLRQQAKLLFHLGFLLLPETPDRVVLAASYAREGGNPIAEQTYSERFWVLKRAMKYFLSVLAFGFIVCSGVASAESPQTVPVPPLSDREAATAAQAKADAADLAMIRAARIKADAVEKADRLPQSWDRDADGKRPWQR